jgi:hypothetical protein
VQETSIATTQERGEGGMAMEAEEEGRKGIPCLLSSREENIASNITEVLQSSFLSRSVDICFQSSPLLSRSVDICFLVKLMLTFVASLLIFSKVLLCCFSIFRDLQQDYL